MPEAKDIVERLRAAFMFGRNSASRPLTADDAWDDYVASAQLPPSEDDLLTPAYMAGFERGKDRGIAIGREQAAVIAGKWDGKPCGTAEGWTEEQRQFYDAGQMDAASSITFAIRAAKEVTK